jgi:hypothetical protein
LEGLQWLKKKKGSDRSFICRFKEKGEQRVNRPMGKFDFGLEGDGAGGLVLVSLTKSVHHTGAILCNAQSGEGLGLMPGPLTP